MKFSTPGYQDMGKILRGSMSHFKHQHLKIRGQLSMLGSKSLNLKMRGQPSLLGSKSSPVSLHQNLEMRVLGTKPLSCVMMITLLVVYFVYYFMLIVATMSIMEFYGCLSFTGKKWGIGDMFNLGFITFVGDEIWKLNYKANASALTSKDYDPTLNLKDDTPKLTSKDDAAAIRNPFTAAEDAVLATLISLDGISKQLKDITRQISTNVAGGAQNKSILASLEGIRGQISSVLDIGNPCGQSHIIEAQCAASSTSEEEDDEARLKLEPYI